MKTATDESAVNRPSTGKIPAGLPPLAPAPAVADDGGVAVPSFELPFSAFASTNARDSYVRRLRNPMPIVPDIAEIRKITDEKIRPQVLAAQALYPCTSSKSTLAGIPIETFLPAGGIAPENEHRVLINLHGGGFVAGGGGVAGAVESIPVAGEGRIKVISVDYRLAPEHPFPAPNEDLEAVYRALIEKYRPETIGIYGCSAGGVLTGQAIAWFLKQQLPLPGAVGIFCASLHGFDQGDSAHLQPRLGSVIRIIPPQKPNIPEDPLVRPSASKAVLKAFPPTLFLTGTRAPEMSGACQSHLELRELGVNSNLLLFDGLDHGFYSDVTLPESKRAITLMTRFFADNLGTSR